MCEARSKEETSRRDLINQFNLPVKHSQAVLPSKLFSRDAWSYCSIDGIKSKESIILINRSDHQHHALEASFWQLMVPHSHLPSTHQRAAHQLIWIYNIEENFFFTLRYIIWGKRIMYTATVFPKVVPLNELYYEQQHFRNKTRRLGNHTEDYNQLLVVFILATQKWNYLKKKNIGQS